MLLLILHINLDGQVHGKLDIDQSKITKARRCISSTTAPTKKFHKILDTLASLTTIGQ